MIRLVFIGKHEHHMVRRDRVGFERMLRATYPLLRDVAIAAIVKAELEKHPPRHDGYVVHILGRDILGDDPTSIPAWPWMTNVVRGDVVDLSTNAALPVRVRETALDPDCIPEQTYVWRKENNWVQEVSDEDAARIRASQAKLWFRRFDDVGYYNPLDPWTLPVVETQGFASVGEYERFRREETRRPQWRGR